MTSNLTSPVLMFTLFNPLPWLVVAHDGPYDGAVGIVCVAAVYCLEKCKDRQAAAWLAAGALMKFSPLLILPFLAFGPGRLRVPFAIWTLVFFCGGMALSLLAWGPSTFNPLTFAATRPSEESIYDVVLYALTSGDRIHLPADWASAAASIDRIPTLTLAVVGLGTFAWCACFRPAPALGAFIGLLAALTFYRMGYLQYQMTLFCVASYWAASQWREIVRHRHLAVLLTAYFCTVGVLALIEGARLELTGPLWYFILGTRSALAVALLLALLRFAAMNRAGNAQPAYA